MNEGKSNSENNENEMKQYYCIGMTIFKLIRYKCIQSGMHAKKYGQTSDQINVFTS